MKRNALTKGMSLPKQKQKPRLELMRGETLSKATAINGSKRAPAQGAVPVDLNMMKQRREPVTGPDLPVKKGKGEVDPTALEPAELRREARALQAKAIDLRVFIFARVIVKKEINVIFGILQFVVILRREIARWVTSVLFFTLRVLFPLLLNPVPRRRLKPKPVVKAGASPWCLG